MKISYTKIVGIEADDNSVVIKFRPQGSDSADRPLTVRVAPHNACIYVNLSIGNKAITKIESGANIANISYGDRD